MNTIENMTYEQLAALKADVEGLMQKRRQDALEELRAKAQAMGFSMADFAAKLNGDGQRRKRRTKAEMIAAGDYAQ